MQSTFPPRLLLRPAIGFVIWFQVFSVSGDNWPAWRGASGQGIAADTSQPLHWSTTKNVRWKMGLPDRGNSTPIVWNDRVFITQAIEKEHRRTLMCFARRQIGQHQAGELLWQRGVVYSESEPTHETNPYCAASPVTDGERVIASFGSAGLYCYDLEGKELWHRDLGPQIHIWGNASSPVIHRDQCLLSVGPGERTSLVALDKKTGRTLWQHDEPGGDSGQPKPGAKAQWIGSWSTPLITEVDGQDQVLMSYPGRLVAFEPRDGKELWSCGGLNPLVYTSPLRAGDVMVAMGGFNGATIAVKTGGQGDVTATHQLWRHPKTKQRIGSGVVAKDHIYILDDPGIAECIELRTGKVLWQERLTGAGPKNSSWSSMVLAGDKLYVVNHSGDTFVLRADPVFEVLATNSVGETTMASVAVADDELFLRTYKHLWCIGTIAPK